MKNVYALIGALLLSTPVFANESPEALQEAFMAALENNDSAAVAACYSADAVNYSVSKMVGIGPEAVKADWDTFFARNVVKSIRLSKNHLETHGDVAFAWGQFHMRVVPIGSLEAVKLNGRYMDVARNIDGKWLYVADHASVPTGDD